MNRVCRRSGKALLMWATIWHVTPSDPEAEFGLLELMAFLTSSAVTELNVLLRSMVRRGAILAGWGAG